LAAAVVVGIVVGMGDICSDNGRRYTIEDVSVSIVDIHPSIVDIHPSIVDIHPSIVDIHPSIVDIHPSIIPWSSYYCGI
jgi:hypothetical protein